VAHFEPILARPLEDDYSAIARALLEAFPMLKDGDLLLGKYNNNMRLKTLLYSLFMLQYGWYDYVTIVAILNTMWGYSSKW
jgi:hypothetical protein